MDTAVASGNDNGVVDYGTDPETEEKKKHHLVLTKKLHAHYSQQLNSCLVSLSKFEKATKLFIIALRSIRTDDVDIIPTLRYVEEKLKECTDDPEMTNTYIIIDAFLQNIHNFRIFRQQIKMNIYLTMKNFPEELMNSVQKRTYDELEVMLNTWSTLTSRDYDLSKIEHSSVEDHHELFDDEAEIKTYQGIMSVLPKLADMANRIDFLLIKYQM
uniref:Uncharacterized protein LOC102805853 n=1 Tax=Saccoglossus kowalevskii TaxID=10224 RepID=A0ABM0MJI3_SACKO|nr:PREDICTED: uncharacterized protein LOC102805853 [Saccoglossus kowalevskii]